MTDKVSCQEREEVEQIMTDKVSSQERDAERTARIKNEVYEGEW